MVPMNFRDPNGKNLPNWPKYDSESKKMLHIQENIGTQRVYKPNAIHFWNVIVEQMLEDE